MTSKYNFLGNEIQVTNSDEIAVHVYKGLAEMRFKQIIELEDENYEQRGQMALLREEIKQLHRDKTELQKDKERLDFLLNCAYAIQINEGDIVSSREKIDEAMNQATQ